MLPSIWTIDPQFQVCKRSRTSPRTQHRPGSTINGGAFTTRSLGCRQPCSIYKYLGHWYQLLGMLDVNEAPLANASATKTQPFDLRWVNHYIFLLLHQEHLGSIKTQCHQTPASWCRECSINNLKINSNPSTVVRSLVRSLVRSSVRSSVRSVVRSPRP